MSISIAPTSAAERLRETYYNAKNPAGYAGIAALRRETKLPTQKVVEWLRRERVYTLHKPARRTYPTRHYQVSTMDQQWQADLNDLQPHAQQNRGYRYILTVIDILSRYAWAEPLKSKTPGEVINAFRRIFRANPRRPRFLQTDQGTEFENHKVRNFLRQHNITQFSVKSPFKAAMVERFNRTLKARMWRYFTHHGTRRWIDVLPQLLHAYNHSFHRILGRRPVDVTRENEMEVWQHIYGKKKKPKKKTKFSVGDLVRLSKVKGNFEKGYLPNWTEEEFTVHAVDIKHSPVMYQIRDTYGEVIEGKFYDQELQKIENPEKLYMIERVIRKRQRRGGEREVLVKWLGYPETTWIREADIIRTA